MATRALFRCCTRVTRRDRYALRLPGVPLTLARWNREDLPDPDYIVLEAVRPFERGQADAIAFRDPRARIPAPDHVLHGRHDSLDAVHGEVAAGRSVGLEVVEDAGSQCARELRLMIGIAQGGFLLGIGYVCRLDENRRNVG